MTSSERWLAATWPIVRARLPPAPARIVELGCGPLGGFVPMLRSHGYDATGIDPKAPDEPHYQQSVFERAELPQHVDAVVASVSLHHVADPAHVLDRIAGALASGGRVVVIEWAWERFDDPTAAWCFDRLGSAAEPGWLHRRRDEWLASGDGWSSYLQEWSRREGLHAGEALVGHLDARFERHVLSYGPYFFAGLADTTEADEQAAIDTGEIQATRIEWVGALR
jgi:SAM-dependent methyltransferase